MYLYLCGEWRGGKTMRFVWRILMRRCTRCGQRLNGHRDAGEVTKEINDRAVRLASQLGRSPRAQNCFKCNHMILEGEPGFAKRYLLVDIV
jgi:hypothetical protein